MTNFFRSKVNYLILILFFVLMGLLQTQLWHGETGYYANDLLRANIQRQEEINQALQARNRILFAEMEDLRNGVDVVEEYARLDLGLIKKNETFIQINTAKAQKLPDEFLNQPEVKIAPMMEDIAPEINTKKP